MFDSNLNKDKLLRLKLGAGKVIKVSVWLGEQESEGGESTAPPHSSLSHFLQGWEEGMLGMRKGGRRILVVPPGQAYGSQGVQSRIPGNSTLIFETEIRRVGRDIEGGLSNLYCNF